MESKKEKKQSDLVFWGKKGCNAGYYVALNKKYPLESIRGGDYFVLEDLAEVLGLRLDVESERRRFESVIAGWRRKLFESKRLFTRRNLDEIIVSTDSDKVNQASRLNKQALKKLEKGFSVSLSVNTSNLTEIEKRQHEQNLRVYQGMELARTKERVVPSLE